MKDKNFLGILLWGVFMFGIMLHSAFSEQNGRLEVGCDICDWAKKHPNGTLEEYIESADEREVW